MRKNIKTYCVLLNLPVSPAIDVALIPLYKPDAPPIPAPAIHAAPIWLKANSKRPLCFTAPSGNINSGWLTGRYEGSKFKYGLSGARPCCVVTEKNWNILI